MFHATLIALFERAPDGNSVWGEGPGGERGGEEGGAKGAR